MAFLPAPAQTPPRHSIVGGSHLIPSFSLGTEEKDWNLFATFWLGLPRGCLRDLLLFDHSQSTDANSGIVCISTRSPTESTGTCWATWELQGDFRAAGIWCKRLQEGEYNRTFKAFRRSRRKTLWETETFKSSQDIVELEGNHTHRHREDIWTENAWEDLYAFTLDWWVMAFPCKEPGPKY